MTAETPSRLVPELRFPEFDNAREWETRNLENLVFIQSGGTPSKADPAFWDGSIPWVSAKDMKRLFLEDTEDHISIAAVDNGARVVPAGTLLILTRGMTLLKDVPICVLRREMSFNQDVKGLLPKKNVNGLFLALALLANKQRLLKMVNIAGHGTGKLNTGELEAFELAFPRPAEQQKIAGCLGSLDDLIAVQGQKLETLRQHKRGMMQQLFPRPGETEPRLRFPEFVNAGWESKTLGTLISNTERPIVMDDETEYALVTVKRRYGGVVSREVLKGKEISVKSQFLIEVNDFLVSKRQIVHDACGLVPAELAGSIVSNEYSVLTAKNGCDMKFFNYFTQQPCVSESFLQASVGIVIEKMLFKLDRWLKFAFPFPSFAEQQRIADCLSSLDAQLDAQVQKLYVLKAHKQGLLQQLFTAMEG
jgi:type I restriction enzyme S subunit